MPREGWEQVLLSNSFTLTKKLHLRHEELALLRQEKVLGDAELQRLEAIPEAEQSKRAFQFLEMLHRKSANHYKKFYMILIETDQGALADLLEPHLAASRQERQRALDEPVAYRREPSPRKSEPSPSKPDTSPPKQDPPVTSSAGASQGSGGASNSARGDEGRLVRPQEEMPGESGDTPDNDLPDEGLTSIRIDVKKPSNPHTINLGASRDVYDVKSCKTRVWVDVRPHSKATFRHKDSDVTFTRLDVMRKQLCFQESFIVKHVDGRTKKEVLTRVNQAARTRAAMMVVALEGVGYLEENGAAVFGKNGSSDEITWTDVAAAMNTSEMRHTPKILLMQITNQDDLSSAFGRMAFDATVDTSSFERDFYVVASKLEKRTEQMLLLNYFVSVVENCARHDDFNHMMTMVENWVAKKISSQKPEVMINTLQKKLFFFPIPESASS